MGYVDTSVTVLEDAGVAQLTVAISVPPQGDPIETSFFLLVNTNDGTATAAGLSSYLEIDLHTVNTCSDSESVTITTEIVNVHSYPLTHHNKQHVHSHTLTHILSHTIRLSTAPGDYGALADFRLGPFSNSVRQLSFNVSIVNDMIPEDDEDFTARLTLSPADRARLGTRVTVQPDLANVTIQDDDGTLAL